MDKIFSSKELFKKTYIGQLEKVFAKKYQDTTDYEKYVVIAKLVKEYVEKNWKSTKELISTKQAKQIYYFSMEYLMGRLLTNNLMNLGIYTVVKESLSDLGFDLNIIETKESDIGIGNGGLGRLAACFLDSLASLSYPGHGVCIRYSSGFFQQKFVDGHQVELPELWLKDPFIWENRADEDIVLVPFFGDVECIENMGKKEYIHKNALMVRAIPYDVPVVGYLNNIVNNLTLWSAEPVDNYQGPIENYEEKVLKISESLYPNDSTEEGKILRLQQQYFFVCAGVRRIINHHKSIYKSLDNLHEKVILHINDTHPTLIIPELMRILIDEEGYSWEKAWEITMKTCAYTNHTIMTEALEKWKVGLFKQLLPRIYMIIVELDRRFKRYLVSLFGVDDNRVENLAIINNNLIHMAHICIVGSFSVNGVAELHTKILKEVEMKDFNEIYPNKFNNKTNGMTHRRWLLTSNPHLTTFLDNLIGKEWHKDINRLAKLNEFVHDKKVKNELYQVKQTCKKRLADYIKEKEGIDLNIDSIFDIHIKRLHEYKRQLMNGLHIMYLYHKLQSEPSFYHNFHPQTFIFGAKAAGSYKMAKKIIKLINSIAEKVNNDPIVNEKLKVVFVENYNVSYAELLIPAANVSEQISTTTKEASGTGNMKLMMNGALTIGTLDGANVEIVELVGHDNAFIFGLTADEVNSYYKNKNYVPKAVYDSEPIVKLVVDNLINGFFENENPDEFKVIYDDLIKKDHFFVLKDLKAYADTQKRVNEAYKNQDKWLEMALINIANSAFFASDRTIEQYVKAIWKLERL